MREKIRLVSSAETGHFYTTTKNKTQHSERMERSRYCKHCRRHTKHKEIKS